MDNTTFNQMVAAPRTFSTIDFAVFAMSILSGAIIGIYISYFAPKSGHEEEDLIVGGRRMGIVPIGISLVASYISGITLLGAPSEVSVFGCQVMYYNITYWIVSFFYIKQILPVFYSIQGLSLNEYFVRRFDRRLRILGSILYVTVSMGWLPIVIYVPALAYEQVTGYNVHYVTPIVSLVCIFYTSMGGIKAVVWTDVLQMFFMTICVLLVIIKGTYDIGGLSVVWDRNVASGRIEPPHVDFDPTTRHTIFGIAVNGFLGSLMSGCLNQGMVQRHQSLPTLSKAKKSVWVYTFLVVFTYFASGFCGLVMAANYYDCDPVTIKLARTKDQLVPLFVMQSIGHIPGASGLFIAGIFSAALSSMSTALNTMSAVFIEDWVRGCNLWNPTDHQAAWAMKIFVVVMGVITVLLVSIVEKLGMVAQMSTSLASISSGPMLTIFICGLFLPWVTSTGALFGAAAAAVSVAPLMLGTQYYISQGALHFPAKPISLENCSSIYNISAQFMETVTPPPETLWPSGPTRGDVMYPFRISYLWYLPISIISGLTTAFLVTYFFSKSDLSQVDYRLIAPVSRRWLPKHIDDTSERGHHMIIEDLENSKN